MSEQKKEKPEWIKLEQGIRARKHPTRKHGVKADMYFVLRFTVDGKDLWKNKLNRVPKRSAPLVIKNERSNGESLDIFMT
ncbi:MAG: hypothetical protein IJU76_11530 [Desulfovibrionaceae bacterium]|nr:hypothetical protein [Desulfovibrionaceae bacterium]